MSTREALAIQSSRRGRVRGLHALLFALATCVHAPVAFAQQHDTARYHKLIEEALQDFDRGNWEEAGALFTQAHALNPNARTLRGMGLAAFEGRHYAEALRHLRAALEDKRFALTADQRRGVEQAIERAQQYVGHVRFTLEPAEAALKIDGEPVELDASGELVADPGLLDVEASADGYTTQVRRVHVSSGATEDVAIKLELEGQELPQPAAVTVPAASSTPAPPVNDTDHGGSAGTLKWIAGGLAVAGIATGAIALALGDSAAKKWNACRDDSVASCVAHRDTASTDRTIGVVGFAAGGAFAVASVVLFIVDGKSGSSAASATACGPGAGELSLSCRVAF
jgi:hypothetical protein